jgi:hypothetical protein
MPQDNTLFFQLKKEGWRFFEGDPAYSNLLFNTQNFIAGSASKK